MKDPVETYMNLVPMVVEQTHPVYLFVHRDWFAQPPWGQGSYRFQLDHSFWQWPSCRVIVWINTGSGVCPSGIINKIIPDFESEFADKHRLGEDWIKGVTRNNGFKRHLVTNRTD